MMTLIIVYTKVETSAIKNRLSFILFIKYGQTVTVTFFLDLVTTQNNIEPKTEDFEK